VITGIVVALPEELSTLTSNKIAIGCCVFINGTLVLAFSGAGADNAQIASELLVSQGATRLISWGCAGALVAPLNPGDLVLADTLIGAEGCQIEIDPVWLKAAQNALTPYLKVRTGCLVESKSIVATAEDKKQLHLKMNAIVVDMESIAIAKIAARNKLPFLAIRAIADPLSMDLPKAINHALNAEGHILLRKLLLFIAQHPAEIPGLIKLGLHFHAAKKSLRIAAQQLDHLTATVNQD
jgi:adenosylhomocysteine nucleosidase